MNATTTSASLTSEADHRAPATDLRSRVPAILTIDEAGEVLTVSRRTMAELIASGRLAAKRVGRRRIVLRSSIETMLGAPIS